MESGIAGYSVDAPKFLAIFVNTPLFLFHPNPLTTGLYVLHACTWLHGSERGNQSFLTLVLLSHTSNPWTRRLSKSNARTMLPPFIRLTP